MEFVLTDGQSQAVEMVKKLTTLPLFRPHIARIRGPAGTGKTTLMRVLGREIGEMSIITPTGKSALRVTEATSLEASTAHRWMYTPREDPRTGKVTFQRNTREKMVRPKSGVITIDEGSMFGLDLWEDVYETAKDLSCHVLIVGDPFQLPPVEEVKRSEPFGLLEDNFKFDLNTDLTEVTRQAKESPIIRASMMIREGNVEAAVMMLPRVKEADLLQEQLNVLENKGVVIVYKNASRHELNSRVRDAKGLPKGSLVEGEPLLVLRNNYDLNRFNGEVLSFDSWVRLPAKQWEVYHRYKDDAQKSSFGLAKVEADEASIAMGAVSGRMDTEWVGPCLEVSKHVFGEKVPYLHCNYGYTMTAHKSQGSEWNQGVVVVEPSVRINTKDGKRWFYTAVTRFRQDVKIAWNLKIS
jgi:exodeoxyribonuclease-5